MKRGQQRTHLQQSQLLKSCTSSSAHFAWWGMLRSISPKLDVPISWSTLISPGADMHLTNSQMQRRHSLVMPSNQAFQRGWRKTQLAKAVSITRKRQKEVSSHSDCKGGGKDGQFFRPGPPARYGDRQGRFQTPYSQPHYSQRGKFNPRRGGTYFQAVPYRSQPQYQPGEKKPDISNAKHKPVKSPTEEVLELLRSLPPKPTPKPQHNTATGDYKRTRTDPGRGTPVTLQRELAADHN